MIRIGVIGYGYWGPNLVRNFSQLNDCVVKTVADTRPGRLEALHKIYPSIAVTADYKTVLSDAEIDAVVIAVPVFLHFPVAKEALEKGKHVLIEKPMTTSVAQAEELIALAEKKRRTLMVDHTFVYTGVVQKIKSVIASGEIGDLNYFDSTRINLGLFQHDINVLWDLAPHDISILNFLTGEKPVSVSATGISHTGNGIENIAYLTLHYSNNFIAHFHCSWTSPVKIRKILIGGSRKMIVYDDVEPTEKIKIYDTGYSMRTDEDKHKLLVDYRTGDIYIPKTEQREALLGVAGDFVSAIRENRQTLAGGTAGLEVVRVLEAAGRSLREKGKEITL
ncbi:MAG TPA: Gfo/Idh/MocA family oxidoreductase [Bacteroidia bacterium]|nr:Gfo/Idh/MocA family oxidoreductase [Bacteroidia bacterium]